MLLNPPVDARTGRAGAGIDTRSKYGKLLGGLDGIEILEKNSHVLVEMAMHLQKWYPEEAAAAEELRLQAKELGWHWEKLRMAADKGHLEFHFCVPMPRAQRSTIILMTQRLLSLCHKNTLPMFAEIEQSYSEA